MVMLAQDMRRPHLAVGVQQGQRLRLVWEWSARRAPAWAGLCCTYRAEPQQQSWVVTAAGRVGGPVIAG